MMIEVRSAPLEGVRIIIPKRFRDDRGYFVEAYNSARLADHGIETTFVQDNQSLSREIGTVRGLHYQRAPLAQAKLISVVVGAIFDVVVDLRRESPTFGAYFAEELSADNGHQLYIPKGFAHGFCTLTPDVILTYKVDAYYSAEHDAGIIWDDPGIGIAWPSLANPDYLSQKDRELPNLRDLDTAL